MEFGYIDGFNLKKSRDSFNLKDNILSTMMEFKKIFVKNILKVSIKGKNYNIVGKLGMNHAVVDITNSEDISVGDEVIISTACPIYINSNIRREYI